MGCLDAPRMVLARMDVVTVAINCMAATCTDILFVSKLFEGRDRYTQERRRISRLVCRKAS